MSQLPNSGRGLSPATSEITSTLSESYSTDPGDTGSIFKAPNTQIIASQASSSRPKRSQHQAQLSFNQVSIY